MPKGNKEESIKNILKAAEELFSVKGFSGTSISMICEKAGVSKALIYYHFKDKEDIINSLFENIITECDENVKHFYQPDTTQIDILDEIKEEIDLMHEKEKIIKVMFMESLKDDNKYNYFFKFAEKIIKNEANKKIERNELDNTYSENDLKLLIYEFFTGVIPIITFVVFKNKWCDYFNCNLDEITNEFLDSFKKTHLSNKKEDI